MKGDKSSIDIREYIKFYEEHSYEELDKLINKNHRTKLEYDIAYIRKILRVSYSVPDKILKDTNVDPKTLSYKDQKKTKQEDRLLLLFFLNNGIIDTKLMNEYDIPLIYLSILGKKWDITQLIRGIYSLDKLGTYWQLEFQNNPTLVYAIYNKDKIVVSGTEYDEKQRPIYSLYVSKKYQGKIPSGKNIKITYVEDDNLLLYTSYRSINKYLKFYEYTPIRKFAEQVKKLSKLFHSDIIDFIESEEFEYLYLQYKNLKLVKTKKEDLENISIKLKIPDVVRVYDFLDRYYKRR